MSAPAVTVALAFAGYAVTCPNGPRLTRRQERPARVNRQLGQFYRPLSMRGLLIRHADLLDDRAIPPILLQPRAHVSGYGTTTARWGQGVHHPSTPAAFPGVEPDTYARQGFTALKREQYRLPGGRAPCLLGARVPRLLGGRVPR